MALQRVIGTTKRAENMAKFGTVAVLVNWPKENVNIYILTQRATFISCNNSPKVETAHIVFFAVFLGANPFERLYISSADTI